MKKAGGKEGATGARRQSQMLEDYTLSDDLYGTSPTSARPAAQGDGAPPLITSSSRLLASPWPRLAAAASHRGSLPAQLNLGRQAGNKPAVGNRPAQLCPNAPVERPPRDGHPATATPAPNVLGSQKPKASKKPVKGMASQRRGSMLPGSTGPKAAVERAQPKMSKKPAKGMATQS